MNSSYRHRFLDMQKVFFLLGVCLTVYFSWHAIAGHRSLSALKRLDVALVAAQGAADDALLARQALQARVVMLRGDSLDMDYVEELAVKNLGFAKSDVILVSSVASY